MVEIEPQSDVNSRISSYTSFKEELKNIRPKIEGLRIEIESQKIPYMVHQIRIDSLSGELGDMQGIIKRLEAKLEFETKVFEKLKKIIQSLSFDQESLHVLEVGSFMNDEDLIKMEKSLNSLTEFTKEKWVLRILKERETEVLSAISNFFKRFLMFLSKMFAKSESKSELKVHRKFYETMMKYKFIYAFSKTNEEYRSILCITYAKKARHLYNEEYKAHLNRISELIVDKNTLKFALDALVMTYRSLLECELNFLNLMSIECEQSDIFMDVDMMILDFIDIFFKKLPCCILCSLHLYTADDFCPSLGSLGEALKKKQSSLEEVFLYQQKNLKLNSELVELFNGLGEMKIGSNFAKGLEKIIVSKACNPDVSLEQEIKNLQLVNAITHLESKSQVLEKIEGFLTLKIIDRVFGSKDEKTEIDNILKYLKPQNDGYGEALGFMKKTILDNCEEPKRAEYVKILSRVGKA